MRCARASSRLWFRNINKIRSGPESDKTIRGLLLSDVEQDAGDWVGTAGSKGFWVRMGTEAVDDVCDLVEAVGHIAFETET